MFPIKAQHAQRIKFVTKLFPNIKSPLGLNSSKLKSITGIDGDLFLGGRSKNRDLLTFFGFIADQHGSSTFAQLPLFRRCLRKLTDLVEQELEVIGAQNVLLPTLIPQKLWQQSQRLQRQQDALEHVYNFVDKSGNKLLLGPTFEESITKLIANLEPLRESELPVMLYQTSDKFRFEPYPKFGLIRSNQFLMNDLYTFDSSLEGAKETYEKISHLYASIFDKLHLECVRIESETGNIGGKYSHEYQLPVSSGEDTMIKCDDCGYAFNIELCSDEAVNKLTTNRCLNCKSINTKQCHTLELGHTFLLSDTYSKPMKARIVGDDGSKVNYEMGCYGLGLTRILGAGLDLYSIIPDQHNETLVQMRWPTSVEPFKLGIVSPAKRSKQYNAGSTQFIERIADNILEMSSSTDIIVEDRDKEGVFKRIARLQSLGIPYILVVGQRFLQDIPEIELLKLESDKKGYERSWLTEEQLYDFLKKI